MIKFILPILIIILLLLTQIQKQPELIDENYTTLYNYPYHLREDYLQTNCMETVFGGIRCYPWNTWPRWWAM